MPAHESLRTEAARRSTVPLSYVDGWNVVMPSHDLLPLDAAFRHLTTLDPHAARRRGFWMIFGRK